MELESPNEKMDQNRKDSKSTPSEALFEDVEPALTVPDEKIYVRLEDVVFIGEKGAEVVSTDAPWDIDAIEKAMKEEGLLKRYPRVYPVP